MSEQTIINDPRPASVEEREQQLARIAQEAAENRLARAIVLSRNLAGFHGCLKLEHRARFRQRGTA